MASVLLVFNRKPYFDGVQEGKMRQLAQWVREADKVIPF